MCDRYRDPTARPDTAEWLAALVQQPLSIDHVTYPLVVISGRTTQVTWHCPAAAAVEIRGDPPSAGSAVVTAQGTQGAADLVLTAPATLTVTARTMTHSASTTTALIMVARRLQVPPVVPHGYRLDRRTVHPSSGSLMAPTRTAARPATDQRLAPSSLPAPGFVPWRVVGRNS